MSAKGKILFATAFFALLDNVCADVQDDGEVVASVNVSAENDDLEQARKDAIGNGGIEAFAYELAQQGVEYDQQQFSKEDIARCVDRYSIKDETIGRNFYKATIDYALNRRSLAEIIRTKKGHLKKRPVYDENNTLIVVATQDNTLNAETSPYMYSFSKELTKYRYSKKLDDMFAKAKVNVRYERIN